MDRLVIESPGLLVLADATTEAGRRNAKGHLFERFVALLFAEHGYEQPTTSSLNVTANGIELDVETRHNLTQQEAVAECKAYSTPVRAEELDKFYGKLAMLRLSRPGLFGWFVAIPRLTPEGGEQARVMMEGDQNFSVVTAEDIVEILSRGSHILADPPSEGRYADVAVVVTAEGVYSAGKRLDEKTRLPVSVLVWGAGAGIPDPVVALVSEDEYGSGLPVLRPESPLLEVSPPEVTVVEVTGSSGDFEYQLPASPKFFVGRREIVDAFRGVAAALRHGVSVVVNAQSGWGKSSLALRLRSVISDLKGVAVVLDTRTATTVDYLPTVLRRALLEAEARKIFQLPETAAFSSLGSSLQTIRDATWHVPERPLLIFFDQFENVFRDARLTREFRDLALALSDVDKPVIVGFAWKTDLVAFTEDHPYRYRDDIRNSSNVFLVAPFGPAEIESLLRKLEKAAGVRLNRELRQRLREYSQGLPWLFKKLASHILDELASGTTQEELLAEALNIQSLFERDLAELSPQEQQALRSIARGAPILASDAVETVGSQDLVQSLVDRRLVVQVGERLDVYWDIFRDFLNTGSVPIRDTYILRVTPGSVSRLLRLVVDQRGDLTVSETAHQLGTTEGVVFNLSRELRLMGVLEGAAGHVRLVADIREAHDIEGAVRERISSALKRNTAFALLSQLIDEKGGIAPLPDFAALLPTAFPAVEAVPNTWLIYARAFAQWFAYARLVSIEKGGITLGSPAEGVIELLGAPAKTRVRFVFPQSPPGPALLLAQILAGFPSDAQWTKSRLDKAVNDLVLLGFAEVADEPGVVTGVGVSRLIDESGTVNRDVLRQAIADRPGGDEALRLVEGNPNTPAMEVGAVIGAALGAAWSDGTKQVVGKFFRAWAREAGIQVAMPRRRRARASG